MNSRFGAKPYAQGHERQEEEHERECIIKTRSINPYRALDIVSTQNYHIESTVAKVF